MPRGGKREGAGAPKGNTNALKHGGRAKVIYGVPLNKKLSRFEYRALCLEQLSTLKHIDELEGGWISPQYQEHKKRYKGAVTFSERRSKAKCIVSLENRELLNFANNYFSCSLNNAK